MASPPKATDDPRALLSRALESGRLNASFLLSGASDEPRDAAHAFARGVVCRGDGKRPCGQCHDCRLSSERRPGAAADHESDTPATAARASGNGDAGAEKEPAEPIAIDGTGKKGPLYRHIGDHPDLYWIDRGIEGTRVRISQIRALQAALRLSPNEGGWRAAVIADAEWLNAEAQNALLKLLEEPPGRTCLVLCTASPAGLLATIRSRCQRVAWGSGARPALRSGDVPEEVQQLAVRLDRIGECKMGDLLDWAEEYRGPRAIAAQKVQTLIASGAEWLREQVTSSLVPGADELPNVRPQLDAFATLSSCRKDLAQRNANPQMVAERALIAVRRAVAGR